MVLYGAITFPFPTTELLKLELISADHSQRARERGENETGNKKLTINLEYNI